MNSQKVSYSDYWRLLDHQAVMAEAVSHWVSLSEVSGSSPEVDTFFYGWTFLQMNLEWTVFSVISSRVLRVILSDERCPILCVRSIIIMMISGKSCDLNVKIYWNERKVGS